MATELIKTSLYGDAKGYWKLEADGTDETSNSNDLTDNGSPTYPAVKFGNGVSLLIATTDFLEITDANQTGLDITGDISGVAWGSAISLSTLNPIFSKSDAGIDERGYVFGVDSNGYLYFGASDDGSNDNRHFVRYLSDTHQISTGTLYHLAFSFDISTETCTFYLDGVSDTSSVTIGSTIGATINDSTSSFAIGCNFNAGASSWKWNGKLDDVGVFDRLITQVEITELNSRKTGGIIMV